MNSGGLLTNALFSAAGDTVNLAATEVEYESRRVQRTRRTMDDGLGVLEVLGTDDV